MSYFGDALYKFEDMGVFDILLPFLLVFTLIYAILTKTKILGEKKNFNTAIALVIALFVVTTTEIVKIMRGAIPAVAAVVVALLMFFILIGLWGGEAHWAGGRLSGWIAIISMVVVVYIFGAHAGWWVNVSSSPWFGWLDNSETLATVVVLLVFGFTVWFVTREDKDPKLKGKLMKDIGELFKGGNHGQH